MRRRKVIPISIGEQARLEAVWLLRDLADEIERMGPDRLDDVLLRIPFGEFEQQIGAVVGRARSRSSGGAVKTREE